MQANSKESVLEDALTKLPREQQPDRDLWRGIELALEEPQKPSNESKSSIWLASAASFALVVSLGWYTLLQSPINDLSEQSAAIVESLSVQHQDSVSALLVNFEGQQAVTENWQDQLRQLDEAALAIKGALEQDPANTALLMMLQHVYQQQIALIERVHAPKWQQI